MGVGKTAFTSVTEESFYKVGFLDYFQIDSCGELINIIKINRFNFSRLGYDIR